jgi:hypothetical protein
MTQINRQLSLWQGPNDVQLHLTDAYGHINGVVTLSLAECQHLSEALDALSPSEVIDVEDVVVEDEAPEAATSWNSLTKAEIVEVVEELYGVTLERDVPKATLVSIATKLEQESSK